jgi:hypothetical protein
MQVDSRNTVETLKSILSGLPNVTVLGAEIVLSTGVKIQMGAMCPGVRRPEQQEGGGKMNEQTGNSAKMREALEKIRNAIAADEHAAKTSLSLFDINSIVKSALASQPRNCDVGTAEEQSKRFCAFCRAQHAEPCYECALLEASRKGRCEFAWAQMPYAAEQEGGDRAGKGY